MSDLISELDERRNLLDQWRGTKVDDLVTERLKYRHQHFGRVILYLYRVSNSIKNAEGVWLDYLGIRLGLPRPQVEADRRVFGFAPQNVGFNQGPFASLEKNTGGKAGIGDSLYRKLLYGRAAFRISNGSLPDSNVIAKNIFRDPGESANWVDNMDKTATLSTVTADQNLYQLANEARLLDPPAGIHRQIPADQYAFTPGNGEVFRGSITKPAGGTTWYSNNRGVLHDGGMVDSSHVLDAITEETVGLEEGIQFELTSGSFNRPDIIITELKLADENGISLVSIQTVWVDSTTIQYAFNAGELATLARRISIVAANTDTTTYKGDR